MCCVMFPTRFLEWIRDGMWVHIHVSTPCSSGSPLKHLSTGDVTVSDLEWESIMQFDRCLFEAGSFSKSFELPFHNEIWSRPLTQKVLREHGMSHCCQVYLCQCDLQTLSGKVHWEVTVFCIKQLSHFVERCI